MQGPALVCYPCLSHQRDAISSLFLPLWTDDDVEKEFRRQAQPRLTEHQVAKPGNCPQCDGKLEMKSVEQLEEVYRWSFFVPEFVTFHQKQINLMRNDAGTTGPQDQAGKEEPSQATQMVKGAPEK